MAKKNVVPQKTISVKVEADLYRQIDLICARHEMEKQTAITNLLILWANGYLPEKYDKHLY